MRVLYVEDSQSDADLAQRMLARNAPEIILEVVMTLAAAREYLRSGRRFDVVLLDLDLPDGPGLNFLAELQDFEISPAVVVLTGSGEQDIALSALKAGADDYVTKRDDYLAELPEALKSALERHREHALRRTRRMRVLYAEPNAFDVDLARRHFARHAPHIRLDTVSVADEVLERLGAGTPDGARYDVAVLDYRLPGIDGLELVRLLRRQHGVDLPIVLLTGHGSGEIAAKALRLGVDDYLPKRDGYLFELVVTLEKLRGQVELKRERAELAESEKRFRSIFEHTRAVAVQGFGRDCRVLYWNPASEALYGYSAEEALGRDVTELIVPPEERESVRAEVMRCVDEGVSIPSTELALRHRDGTSLHVLSSLVVITNGRDEKEVYCIDIDVSERVAQRHLQQARSDVLDRIAADEPLDAVLASVISNVEALLGGELRVDLLFTDEDGKILADVRRPGLNLLSPGVAQHCLKVASESRPALAGEADTLQDEAALWAEPLRDEAGNMLGALVVLGVQTGTPMSIESELVAEFSSLASLAVQKRRVADAVRQREAALEMSSRAALELLREEDFDAALGRVLEAVGRSCEVDQAHVFEIHPQAQSGEPAASLRCDWEHQAISPQQSREDWTGLCFSDFGFNRWLELLQQDKVIVGDVDDFPSTESAFLAEQGILSILVLPIFVRSALWGFIGLNSLRRRRRWSASEESVLRILATGISAALERKTALDSLQRAAAVFESTRDGVVITDLDGMIVAINRAYTEITGYSEAEALGRKSSIVKSERQSEAFYRDLWANLANSGHWQGEVWNRRKDGEVSPQWLSISTVCDEHGAPRQYVGVMTDISKLKRSEAELQRLAHYDPLTDLPNRVLVNLRLEHAIEQAHRHGHGIGVLFIDLDRFKDVNDSFGHPVGDELLVKIADRMRRRVRAEDTLARLGGDEFLMVMERLDGPDEAARVANVLIRLLDEPFVLSGGQEVYVGSSVGISCYPQDGTTTTELIQHADAALYQAKAEGRSTYRFFTANLSHAAHQRVEMETRMRRALERCEFELHYQPQINVLSGRIVGCEALLRWRDPERGLVAPADFIPIAEDNGLIVPLGEWTLRAACNQAMQWSAMGLPRLTMAVNLSGRQLSQADLPDRVEAIIRETGMPPECLELELTESTIMGHEIMAGERLLALKALGVTLAIDDFGTGYSSLAYLKRFPIDVLKIDREFVRDLPEDVGDMEIAAAIVAMARTLRMRVVAEGVETGAQLEFLRNHSCDLFQGFFFSPPVHADDFVKLMHAELARG